MIIFKKFAFDSAHFLPNVPDGHKCKNIHGHTYHLTVFLEGELEGELEWVMDFKALKDVVKPVIERLDHQLMNEIPGLENPTAERIVIWIWDEIKPQLPLLSKLELNETPTSGAIYEGK
ncbi:MAG: 6-carboxytetrahydropterin synthase QueD [Reichenbachiella sp.]